MQFIELNSSLFSPYLKYLASKMKCSALRLEEFISKQVSIFKTEEERNLSSTRIRKGSNKLQTLSFSNNASITVGQDENKNLKTLGDTHRRSATYLSQASQFHHSKTPISLYKSIMMSENKGIEFSTSVMKSKVKNSTTVQSPNKIHSVKTLSQTIVKIKKENAILQPIKCLGTPNKKNSWADKEKFTLTLSSFHSKNQHSQVKAKSNLSIDISKLTKIQGIDATSTRSMNCLNRAFDSLLVTKDPSPKDGCMNSIDMTKLIVNSTTINSTQRQTNNLNDYYSIKYFKSQKKDQQAIYRSMYLKSCLNSN